ncbi:hypothetical protein GL218_01911 [Daldinia childiae]|uniref:uncharacterized protein n=1 Tax=Daldinia childiae TaxID=326645 RepID=UPI0014475039|nr:uncharacterized protein GL218_01911 [Daldinia childiae]KAF3063793.1 hypothetical protein GL218_01911 [Daldinia childiae]
MLTFSLLLLCCGLLASAQEKHAGTSVVHHKRETGTCEQTYGEGSQPCGGGGGSTYCFNPKIGQVEKNSCIVHGKQMLTQNSRAAQQTTDFATRESIARLSQVIAVLRERI